MYQALGDAIDGRQGNDVRCILIQAEGDIFTAGNDLGDFARPTARADGRPRPATRCCRAGARATPIVAAVNGRASASARPCCCTAISCSSRTDALLTTPFVNLALVPEAASSLTLPARIGHARAFSMFVLGEAVDARKAVAWGHCERRLSARRAAGARPRRRRSDRGPPASAVRLHQVADAGSARARRTNGNRRHTLRGRS
jgi:enoyl-CoA hydratase/carnithine racemase